MTFSRTGAVWNLALSHEEVVSANWAADEIALGWPNEVTLSLAAATAYLLTIDEIGGSNGVDVTGVIGLTGVVATTPHGAGFYRILATAANAAIEVGGSVGNFVVSAAVNGIGDVSTLIAGAPGVKLVFAVAGAAGQVVQNLPIVEVASLDPVIDAALKAAGGVFGGLGHLLGFGGDAPPAPSLIHGAVMADRDVAGLWESFLISQVQGNSINLLSWRGFFSAQNGGGSTVYANRAVAASWELWTLENNPGGSVSLRSENGNYFTAENGGGDVCHSNRDAKGPWECFTLVDLPNGQVALKTTAKGLYVSVQT